MQISQLNAYEMFLHFWKQFPSEMCFILHMMLVIQIHDDYMMGRNILNTTS